MARPARRCSATPGIDVLDATRSTPRPSDWLESHFREQIFPILTPQALDPAHPFPFIPNKGLGVIFDLVRVSDGEPIRELVMLPVDAAALRPPARRGGALRRDRDADQALRADLLFPGYRRAAARRVPRAARQRHRDRGRGRGSRPLLPHRDQAAPPRPGDPARARDAAMPDALEAVLQDELGGERRDRHRDRRLPRHRRPRRRWSTRTGPTSNSRPITPRFPERIREHDGDCFAAIRAKDIVVHHPYETFDVVLAFLQPGGGRPRRRRDQADALPRRQAVGGDQRADRRGRGGQVGHRGGRAEGALRRGAEPALGDRARARRACRSSTASSTGRPTPRCRWSCGARAGSSAPTAISAPAIITRSPRGSTPISASSPPIRAIGRDAAQLFNYITGYVEPRATGAAHHLAARPARHAGRS